MKRNKAAAGKTPAAACFFDRVGRMMEDGRYLDEFIWNQRDAFRALVDKLTGGVRERPRNFLLILAEENFNPRPPHGVRPACARVITS